ncbi:MAG: alpha/beta hydrolase, partial [Elusimicrobia bacterium]|nr:alpha/beta hydrolase [Elusimicrobiota bacterium]
METRRRLSLAAFLALLPVLPLSLRLAQLQVVEHRGLSRRADDELDRMAVVAAPRAPILDRNGEVLAESLPTWACFLDKRMIKDPQETAEKLSGLLGMPAREILSRYRGGGRFPWIKSGLDYAQDVLSLKSDGLELGVNVLVPQGVPVGTMFQLHGYLANSLTFAAVDAEFLKRSWVVSAMDLPGHGMSQGSRGDIDHWSRYGDAVRHCIRCDFDLQETSLEDERFQEAVYDGVVGLLEDDLR